MNKNSPNQAIFIFCILLCVFCYDFYYLPVGRLFDYIAFALLIFGLVTVGSNIKELVKLHSTTVILALVILFYVAVFGGDTRHICGLFFCLLFGHLMMIVMKTNSRLVYAMLKWAALPVLFTFFIQWVAGKYFGFVIDVSGALSDFPSRIYVSDPNDFRASSIYQEPNSYCIFAFLLSVSLVFSGQKGVFDRTLMILLPVSMVFSNSLWGIGAAGLVLVLFLINKYKKLFFVTVGILLITLPVWLSENLAWRAVNFINDTSVRERFVSSVSPPSAISGGITGNGKSISDQTPTCREQNYSTIIFGNGPHSHCYQEAYGVNGYSYLVYSYGVLGFGGVCLFCFFKDRSKLRMKTLSLFFLFSSYPYITYAIFPLFIVLLFFPEESHIIRSRSNSASLEGTMKSLERIEKSEV